MGNTLSVSHSEGKRISWQESIGEYKLWNLCCRDDVGITKEGGITRWFHKLIELFIKTQVN
jgi:hypothetical protein